MGARFAVEKMLSALGLSAALYRMGCKFRRAAGSVATSQGALSGSRASLAPSLERATRIFLCSQLSLSRSCSHFLTSVCTPCLQHGQEYMMCMFAAFLKQFKRPVVIGSMVRRHLPCSGMNLEALSGHSATEIGSFVPTCAKQLF